MTRGPGKYDKEATALREILNADGVAIIVCDGYAGSGFAIQLKYEALLALPRVLREMADEIERDLRVPPESKQ